MNQAERVPEEEEANVVLEEKMEPKEKSEKKVNQVNRVIQGREDLEGTLVLKETLGQWVILD